MPRPGVTSTRSGVRSARSIPTSTGPWFVAGITGQADSDAEGVRKPIYSLTEYATRFGNRAAHSDPSVYDAVEFYFRDGGSQVRVSRTADAVDATLTAALALFTKDLGPGQVSAPGRTTAAQKLILANHALATNRVAILATTNTNNVATLTAEATIAGITADAERVTALFGPWLTMPGVTSGTTRTVSPEAVVAALMARNDASNVTPNQPSAGDFGISQVGLNVAQSFSDVDRTTLNVNGVNLFRFMYGDVKLYGYRTLADPTTEENFVNLANARLFMAIQAEVDAVAERFVFRQIDGQRFTISEFGGAITGVLLPYWQRGSLYGVTPQAAFRVDVGANVNTPTTIKNKELRANIRLIMSEFAEEVIYDVAKIPTTEAV